MSANITWQNVFYSLIVMKKINFQNVLKLL